MGIALIFDEFCDLVALGLDQVVSLLALELDLIVLGLDKFQHGIGLFGCCFRLFFHERLELSKLGADEGFEFANYCLDVG